MRVPPAAGLIEQIRPGEVQQHLPTGRDQCIAPGPIALEGVRVTVKANPVTRQSRRRKVLLGCEVKTNCGRRSDSWRSNGQPRRGEVTDAPNHALERAPLASAAR